MPIQPEKPVWWKIIIGVVLILIEVKNHLFPSADLLKANNAGEQVGMYIAMVAIIALGCWLAPSTRAALADSVGTTEPVFGSHVGQLGTGHGARTKVPST